MMAAIMLQGAPFLKIGARWAPISKSLHMDTVQSHFSYNPCNRMLRPDGKVEDLGDFSDFYIPPDNNMDVNEAKHLREMQDEVRVSGGSRIFCGGGVGV